MVITYREGSDTEERQINRAKRLEKKGGTRSSSNKTIVAMANTYKSHTNRHNEREERTEKQKVEIKPY